MSDLNVKEVIEIIDEFSDRIPKLIHTVLNSLYTPEIGEKMGASVGNYYKKLVESGIPKEEAIKLASQYALSMKDISKDINLK